MNGGSINNLRYAEVIPIIVHNPEAFQQLLDQVI